MEKNDTIASHIEKMMEHTILEYNPQPVVVDIVKNFWMKHFSPNELRRLQVNEIEKKTKKIYLKAYPKTHEQILSNFASDVVFHLVYELVEHAKRKTWSKF